MSDYPMSLGALIRDDVELEKFNQGYLPERPDCIPVACILSEDMRHVLHTLHISYFYCGDLAEEELTGDTLSEPVQNDCCFLRDFLIDWFKSQITFQTNEAPVYVGIFRDFEVCLVSQAHDGLMFRLYDPETKNEEVAYEPLEGRQ